MKSSSFFVHSSSTNVANIRDVLPFFSRHRCTISSRVTVGSNCLPDLACHSRAIFSCARYLSLRGQKAFSSLLSAISNVAFVVRLACLISADSSINISLRVQLSSSIRSSQRVAMAPTNVSLFVSSFESLRPLSDTYICAQASIVYMG